MACIVLGLCCPLSLQKHKKPFQRLLDSSAFFWLWSWKVFWRTCMIWLFVRLATSLKYVLPCCHWTCLYFWADSTFCWPSHRSQGGSSSRPWGSPQPHALTNCYGSLAGMDKVTTHRMGLPSTAFADGRPSSWNCWEWVVGASTRFFCLLFVWAMSCGPTRAPAAGRTVISRTL